MFSENFNATALESECTGGEDCPYEVLDRKEEGNVNWRKGHPYSKVAKSCVASQLLIVATQVIPEKSLSQHSLCFISELITAQSIPITQSKAKLNLSGIHCSILHWLLLDKSPRPRHLFGYSSMKGLRHSPSGRYQN